tara:strand:- start:5522 stop:5701 length:180 start_codon:yes stop_codon:yes gene_type:complete
VTRFIFLVEKKHHIINTGEGTLRLLYLFDTDAFSDVEYIKITSLKLRNKPTTLVDKKSK